MHKGFWRLFVAIPVVFALIVSPVAPARAESTTAVPATDSIADVAAKAKPSVVGILTTMNSRGTDRGRSAGTGFVYKDGVIITNAHVVQNAAEVMILYADQSVETVAPSQIFADATSDIAVVKVAKKGLVPLTLADSDKLQVGQQVIAVGNPLGFRLGNSVSAGILSGVGRALGSGYPFLQVDAPINPGNSGGPLFDLNGKVIGINSAKMADIGVEGLGFAIPANTAKEIADRLLRDGKVERATLGIWLDEDWQAYFGVPNKEGVTIAAIIQDGPAGKTALRYGDRLIKLDDAPIYTSDDYHAYLATKKPGDWVTITVNRRGQLLSVKVQLASQDTLRKVAEADSAVAQGGILIGLSVGEVQEAADFGWSLAWGLGNVHRDYAAISGSNYAVLYTEYLYVARRIASAYEFGFTPSASFQQAVAKEINRKVEVEMEINGDKEGFLDGATFWLEQKGVARVGGSLAGQVSYTTSPDGKVAIAKLAVRFPSGSLSPTSDTTVSVRMASGRTVDFKFTLKELR